MENKHICSLRRRSDFLSIKDNGKKSIPSKWLLCAFLLTENGKVRLGLTISRQVGNAVVRNKLKRWCRDFFYKKAAGGLYSFDINLIFRPQDNDFYKNLKHSELEVKLNRAWQDIVKNS